MTIDMSARLPSPTDALDRGRARPARARHLRRDRGALGCVRSSPRRPVPRRRPGSCPQPEQKFGLDYETTRPTSGSGTSSAAIPVFTTSPSTHRLASVKAVLGWPTLLGNISANITGPGGGEMVLHADQIFVPTPWPREPQGAQRRLVPGRLHRRQRRHALRPGSHKLNRPPEPGDHAAALPMEAAGRLRRRVREPRLAQDRPQPHRAEQRAGVSPGTPSPSTGPRRTGSCRCAPRSGSSPATRPWSCWATRPPDSAS